MDIDCVPLEERKHLERALSDLANPIKSAAHGRGMKAKGFVLAAIEKALAADNDAK
jgi:hypothetical protein